MKAFVVSGYFINGFTEGHIEMLKAVKSLMSSDDYIIVVVNNMIQQELKYISARRHLWEIAAKIEPVLDEIFGDNKWFIQKSIDRDRTVRETLKYIKKWYFAEKDIFVNSGDVISGCPEEEVSGYEFMYLGQPKISSSGEAKREQSL